VRERHQCLHLQFNYTDYHGNDYTFGPVFNREYLLDLLDLQKGVEAVVSKNKGITLQNVCNAPLKPQNEACNIQNIWGYWQDDVKLFGEGTTYLNHLVNCTRYLDNVWVATFFSKYQL
jgi:hypothetical protein